jgi:hypothetical protein
MNETIPVGVFDPLVVTAAVKVTNEPDVDGFKLEAKEVEVEAGTGFTVSVSTVDVLPALLASPP